MVFKYIKNQNLNAFIVKIKMGVNMLSESHCILYSKCLIKEPSEYQIILVVFY